LETLYTLTSLIAALMGNGGWRDNTSYKFNEDRSELVITAQGGGYTIDYKDGDEWVEDTMVYQELYPLWDDETPEDLDDGITPMRAHDYNGVMYEFTLTLPPTRKRGDTYTVSQIREMITHTEFIDEVVGMGFSYYNEVEEEEED
jgi:hypothetical protein